MTTLSADTPARGERVLAIVGPTAVGKTALAEELASRLHGEIISADSMQVYRGMDIGTAKPAPENRRVPYHCIDLAEPGEPFSAALYQTHARAAIATCVRSGALPVLCGGTGLYVRAALDDLTFPAGEQQHNPVRARYEDLARERGPAHLHALLAKRDARSADMLHPNNVRRVIRALELSESGISYADHVAGLSHRESVYATCFLGVTMTREALYDRIEARVETMIAHGLLDEVRRLLESGFREALTASQAIGYKELVPVIEGTADLASAVETLKRATRRYAKRQLTWFRGDPRIEWLDVTGLSLTEQAEQALEALDWTDRRRRSGG